MSMQNELYHHGILGQKWGVRRFQNKDGSLTAAGKKRQAIIKDLDKKSKQYYSEKQKEFENSEEGLAFKKYKESNPDAQYNDDFGDYMATHGIPAFDWGDNTFARDSRYLSGKDFAGRVFAPTFAAGLSLAPFNAAITNAAFSNPVAAGAAYLGTLGVVAAGAAISAKRDQINTEKKYGLR